MPVDQINNTVIRPALSPPPPAGPAPLPSTRVQVEIGAATDPGKVRANNEDHFLVTRYCRTALALKTNLPDGLVPKKFEEGGYALVVADGMGGTTAGEVASRMAIAAGVSLALESPRWHVLNTPEEIAAQQELWRGRFREIDSVLARHAWADPTLTGMGTTLTLACVVGADLSLYHVGDSRAYLYRQGRLLQLTSDHTVAQEMANAGLIDRSAVGRHRQRHTLTRYIGGGREVEAETQHVPLEDGDRLLVCSDGLNDMVPDAKIAFVLGSVSDPDQTCASLIALALEAGGKDNVTVIVANYSVLPEQAPSPPASSSGS